MAENDIYNNRGRYERFLKRLETYVLPPENRPQNERREVYQIKNHVNVKYFLKIQGVFETKDLSYIHRLRLFGDLLLAAHATDNDFKDLEREDIDTLVAFMHTRYESPKSKADFLRHIRYLWKLLFPVKDEQGHIDDKAYPYPVRHLSVKIHRSKEKLRNDRLKWEEFERVLGYFGSDLRMQAYIMLALESLGRPQEILTRKIKHVEVFDLYAKVWLTEHGKQGVGLLQSIDSYPYLMKWLEAHLDKNNPEAWLFPNTGRRNRGKNMRPENINKKFREACKALSIKKNVTAYSLKRNGVTFRRLRGDTDLEIQHAARWTSAAQLKTYDLSNQEDAMRRELVKRGIIEANNGDAVEQTQSRTCIYCGQLCGFSDNICNRCKRPLDRNGIKTGIHTMEALRKQVEKQALAIEDLKIVAQVAATGTARAQAEGKTPDKEYFKGLIKEMAGNGELGL